MSLCIEKKITLSGRTYEFSCELMQLAAERGVLRYVLDREYEVDGIRLFRGDVTDAVFWTDRPYTLYLWRTRSRGSVFYFNIADSISLSRSVFQWRDLAVDVLVEPGCDPRVLDEHELPPDLPAPLRAYIQSARNLILSNYRAIMRESEAVIRGLSPA